MNVTARGTKPPKTVVEAVKADLKALPAHLAGSGLALSALSLADSLDHGETSPTAKAACAKALLSTLAELRALAPAPEEKDELDELRTRKAARG